MFRLLYASKVSVCRLLKMTRNRISSQIKKPKTLGTKYMEPFLAFFLRIIDNNLNNVARRHLKESLKSYFIVSLLTYDKFLFILFSF
jgi:hypothetical protein